MKTKLHQLAKRVSDDIKRDVTGIHDEGMVIVKAPPGAGKTFLLLELLHELRRSRVAVACFTNAQADDICNRCVTSQPDVKVVRYVSSSSPSAPVAASVVRTSAALPAGPVAVVANTAKWALSDNPTFDYLLVDEAWQISWADLMLLRNLAPRIVLIGDPGQIPPVVSIETDRWETSNAAPHRPAPTLFLAQDDLTSLHALPGSRRLPADTVDLVKNFYDFDFGSFAEPGERWIRSKTDKSKVGRAINSLSDRSVGTILLPTEDAGPPVEIDDDLAKLVSEIVTSLLDLGSTYSDGPGAPKRPKSLAPTDIGVVASHRSMNTRIMNRLPVSLRHHVKVDTTERWQGLERKMMIAVHPLSNTLEPTPFDLETGRLCVMASRHQCGLLIVSRDHVSDTLDSIIPSADQPLGRPDSSGQGLAGHRLFWSGVFS